MLKKIYFNIVFPYYVIIKYFGIQTVMRCSQDPFVKENIQQFWAFISIWTHVLQQIYFYLYVFDCITSKRFHWLVKANNFLFYSLVFPLSLFVTLLFWALYFYNRDLIYPEILDGEVSQVINHAFHTTPMLIITLQLLIMPDIKPSFKAAVSGLTLVLGIYTVILILLFKAQGKWIYVLFNIMTYQQVTVVLIVSYISTVIFTGLGLQLHVFIQKKKRKGKNLDC
uniref:Uncharacterized protein n=1 Tax=Clastoptera arizonana TaxID=38151 RepID=A0A1B6CJJ6_9HEMI